MPFWHIRELAGLAIIVSAMLMAYNMWMTARGRSPAVGEPTRAENAEPSAA
jgi:cbb3-type cytochrome oxidase subunit 1